MKLIIPKTEQVGDKYILRQKITTMTPVKGHNIETKYCSLLPNGQLIRKAGFESNGPSGGAINTVNSLEPAGEHDCFYQLIIEGYLPIECKPTIDEHYRSELSRWGNPSWRVWLHYITLFILGRLHIKVNQL